MKRIIGQIALLCLTMGLAFGQEGLGGYITGTLVCKTNSNGNGLIVTGGRLCASGFGANTICADASTVLSNFKVTNVTPAGSVDVTYPANMTPTSLSTYNIPCESAVTAFTAFFIYGPAVIGGAPTIPAGFCGVNKVTFGYEANTKFSVRLSPTATVSIANNTLANQWTGACLYYD